MEKKVLLGDRILNQEMSKDQFAEFAAAVLRSLPRDLDVPVAQSWIKNQSALAKVLREALAPPQILAIDRAKPFNPAKFIGEGWSIAEQDERSLALSEVNLADIQLVTMLEGGEGSVQGEEKLHRLKKSGHIRLDVRVFQTLWENKNFIPESWRNGKVVYFDGTILRDPFGYRCALFLFWYGDEWSWYYSWLVRGFDAVSPSAVLAE